MIKNNITRLLDSQKIPYKTYELSAEKHGALETARILNLPPEQVFKSIVVTREVKGKPILAIVPGTGEVDLKALAQAVGEKKLVLPTEREAERLTSMQAGGISPLALINKGFQFVLDSSAENFNEINISGGQRGLNISLAVKDLAALINARLAPICRS